MCAPALSPARACAGVQFPSPLRWRGYAPPLTGAAVFECACLGLLRQEAEEGRSPPCGGEAIGLPQLWLRGLR